MERSVDVDDLVGLGEDPVGQPLFHLHAHEPLDGVVEALEVLHVERGDDVDAGVEEVEDVLVALFVAAAGRVGVGEFVHERHLGVPREHGVDVHLLQRHASVVFFAARHEFEAVHERLRLGALVVLHVPHRHVNALLLQRVGLLEHPVRLPDAGAVAEVHLQPPPL